MERAFGPFDLVYYETKAVGPGWDGNGPLALTLRPNRNPSVTLDEQRRIVAELDAEAAQMETVRSLIPRFEAKIQRFLDRVWGNATA
ncbi:MAG: hypothetical protein ABI651_10845 [Verrucomicrobiota bacterium]